MFAGRLLDACSMLVMLYACFIFARCLLDRVNGGISISLCVRASVCLCVRVVL